MLTEVARCFAREQVLAGAQALSGSDADGELLSRALLSEFDGTIMGNAGDYAATSVDDVVAGVLGNPNQCPAIYNPEATLMAVGYFEDTSADVPARWAGLMAAR